MGEIIHFTIAYGDTTSPESYAKKLIEELNFSSWTFSIIRDEVDDGLISTKWMLEGWQSESR
ncbi:MAG: hypothetical protein H8E12_19655 [Rhodobacteraceae bacterium]|nr:hypothetical protein [Paracoccaceae bacterium]